MLDGESALSYSRRVRAENQRIRAASRSARHNSQALRAVSSRTRTEAAQARGVPVPYARVVGTWAEGPVRFLVRRDGSVSGNQVRRFHDPLRATLAVARGCDRVTSISFERAGWRPIVPPRCSGCGQPRTAAGAFRPPDRRLPRAGRRWAKRDGGGTDRRGWVGRDVPLDPLQRRSHAVPARPHRCRRGGDTWRVADRNAPDFGRRWSTSLPHLAVLLDGGVDRRRHPPSPSPRRAGHRASGRPGGSPGRDRRVHRGA